jgi:predicted O-methyltransferase YrrM
MTAAGRRRPGDLRYLLGLRVLPVRVARFHWRARREARRIGDRFSLVSATRPHDLRTLLKLARGRRRVVELGTGTGWTAIALALADPARAVITYDPVARPERELYLALSDASVRERITFVNEPGSNGPKDGLPVDLLYIDSCHGCQATIDEVNAWLPALRPGGLVVMDDFAHPEFPGVRDAVRRLELSGRQRGTMFVHSAGLAGAAIL